MEIDTATGCTGTTNKSPISAIGYAAFPGSARLGATAALNSVLRNPERGPGRAVSGRLSPSAHLDPRQPVDVQESRSSRETPERMAIRRRCSRHRALVGPRLPMGISNASLSSR